VPYRLFHPPRFPGAPPVERGAGPNSGPESRELAGWMILLVHSQRILALGSDVNRWLRREKVQWGLFEQSVDCRSEGDISEVLRFPLHGGNPVDGRLHCAAEYLQLLARSEVPDISPTRLPGAQDLFVLGPIGDERWLYGWFPIFEIPDVKAEVEAVDRFPERLTRQAFGEIAIERRQ